MLAVKIFNMFFKVHVILLEFTLDFFYTSYIK